MLYYLVILITGSIFMLLLGISIGRSILTIKLRREENRKLELELSILKQKSELLKKEKILSEDFSDSLYKTKVCEEIENIIRNRDKELPF